MVQALNFLGAALFAASTVLAADEPQCSLSKKCPEATPCCSREYLAQVRGLCVSEF